MTSYDALDNAGTGFTFDDDDEDFASLLETASAAAEDPTEGSTKLQTEAEQAESEKAAAQAPEPLLEVPSEEPKTAPEEPQKVEPEPIVEEETTPEPASSPASSPTKGRVRVPTEAEQVREAHRVISTLDAYRSLSVDERQVTLQFVTDGELQEADDATVVVKVLNADSMLARTMKALREAYEEDAVDRAFYVMGLDSRTLHNLGRLVTVFTGETYEENLTNLAYSRLVVAGIATLGDREMTFVRATESVLAAAAESTGS